MILKLFVGKMEDNEIMLFMYYYSRNRIVAFFYFVIFAKVKFVLLFIVCVWESVFS